jgi:hypothetical protein
LIVKVLPLAMVVEARAPPARSAALAAKPTANRFTTALTLIILMLILFMGVGSARTIASASTEAMVFFAEIRWLNAIRCSK